MEAIVLQCLQSGQPWGHSLPVFGLGFALPEQLTSQLSASWKALEESLNHGAEAPSCRAWSS